MFKPPGPEYVLVAERLARPTQVHSHYSVQLTLGVEAPVHALVAGARMPPTPGILIGSNVPHTVAGDVVHLLVEPLAPLGRRLCGMLAERPCLLLDAWAAQSLWGRLSAHEWVHELPRRDTRDDVAALLETLERRHGRAAPPPLDGRVGRVIGTLQAQLEARVPLERLADEARLSPSRLTHLFTEQVGMPIKQYVVWLRMLAVIRGLLRPGARLGALAHTTGFPDQPALTRAYRRAWGRTPSSFQRFAQASHPSSGTLKIAAGINRF